MVTAAICLLIPPFNGCSVSLAHVVVTHGPLLCAYSETRCSLFVHHFAKLSHNVSILVYTCSLLGATCILKSLVSSSPCGCQLCPRLAQENISGIDTASTLKTGAPV